jgi:hypothetical protein
MKAVLGSASSWKKERNCIVNYVGIMHRPHFNQTSTASGTGFNLPAHIINVRQVAGRGEVCLNKDGPGAVSRLTVICIP